MQDERLLETRLETPARAPPEIGDVTGDGIPDIVGFHESTVDVTPQVGNGTFGATVHYPAERYGGGMAVADVTGDGRKDVVISSNYNRPGSGMVVLRQSAQGTLGASEIYEGYDLPEATSAYDLDLDGRNDVITVHCSWERVGIYLQQSSGTLQGEDLYYIPYSACPVKSLAVGDVNSDGLPDIAMAAFPSATLRILRQTNEPPLRHYTVQTQTGQSVIPGTSDLGLHCEECGTRVQLPFPFTLYNHTYSSAWVNVNGYLEFQYNEDEDLPSCIPTPRLGRAIAAFWWDLNTTHTGGGRLHGDHGHRT